MANDSKVRRLKYRSRDGKAKRVRIPSRSGKIFEDAKKPIKLSEKKDWECANCSVCMEAPHNAVLLLCSSYNKGCRPYMCATSYRFSNCLDQYKKAYSKATSEKTKICELLCPLCRGQVKGWTLVEPARKYLNKKKRTCMQEKCSFVGNYRQLKRHVKADHPWARPREVDPSVEEKWKSLENEREIDDVISTLPPGSVVLGDYVIDPNTNPFLNFNMGMGMGMEMEMDMDMDDLLSDDEFEFFDTSRLERSRFRFHTGFGDDSSEDEDEDDEDDGDDEDDDEEDDDGVGVEIHPPRNNQIHPHRNNRGRTLFLSGPPQRWRRN